MEIQANQIKNYIKSYCKIKNNQVIVDDEVVFSLDLSVSPNSFFKELYSLLSIDYPKYYKMDLLCKGAFLATEFIAKNNPIYEKNTALIFSNYSSSFVSDKKHADNIFDKENPLASPAVFVYTLPNIAMGEISIRHKLHSENIFYTFDSFNPQFLVSHNNHILDNKKAENVLSGWIEVKNDTYDIFIYLLDKNGKYSHTEEILLNLYL